MDEFEHVRRLARTREYIYSPTLPSTAVMGQLLDHCFGSIRRPLLDMESLLEMQEEFETAEIAEEWDEVFNQQEYNRALNEADRNVKRITVFTKGVRKGKTRDMLDDARDDFEDYEKRERTIQRWMQGVTYRSTTSSKDQSFNEALRDWATEKFLPWILTHAKYTRYEGPFEDPDRPGTYPSCIPMGVSPDDCLVFWRLPLYHPDTDEKVSATGETIKAYEQEYNDGTNSVRDVLEKNPLCRKRMFIWNNCASPVYRKRIQFKFDSGNSAETICVLNEALEFAMRLEYNDEYKKRVKCIEDGYFGPNLQ